MSEIINIGDYQLSQHEHERRNREGAGKSEHSWIKHDAFGKATYGQAMACRVRFPKARMLLVDGNSGDGIGVAKLQADLFDGRMESKSTARLLYELGRKIGADVVLCEKNDDKRCLLWRLFPKALHIVADHKEVPEITLTRSYDYALWLSDPCGPKDHGIQFMRALGNRVMTDYIVAFNEGWVQNRCGNTTTGHWATHRVKYVPMLDPQWWLRSLNKRMMARTMLIGQSNNFHFRMLVISNYLADAARRHPFIEIIPSNQERARHA